MDGYFIYRRSTLKGQIASNNFVLCDEFVHFEIKIAIDLWYLILSNSRLTFFGNVLTDVGFKIGVRNFKIGYH